jgi:hypothetical protein
MAGASALLPMPIAASISNIAAGSKSNPDGLMKINMRARLNTNVPRLLIQMNIRPNRGFLRLSINPTNPRIPRSNMIIRIVMMPQATDSIVFVTYWLGVVTPRIGAIRDRNIARRTAQTPPAIPQGLAILLRIFIFHLQTKYFRSLLLP